MSNKFLIVAHRGSSGTAPENTIAAFEEAVSSGANMIETDTQLTSDGHFISFHDKALSRTTNGSGFTNDQTLEEIRKLDAGSWFSPKYKGQQVPLLSEVIKTIQNRAYINIEIKNLDKATSISSIENLLEIIYEYKYEKNILFSSFFYKSLLLVKEIDPSIPVAAIRIPKDTRMPSEIKKDINCEAYVCSTDELDKNISEDAFQNNIFIGVYSIDNGETLDKVLEYKVKALVTNYPAIIIDKLKAKGLLF